MKRNEKTLLRIDYATRAVIEALEHYHDLHPGQSIVKRDLLPSVSRRAGWIMDHDDVVDTWDEAIGVPDERWMSQRWSDICLKAAADYRKYVVWNHNGVRLGTFEEYEEIPNNTLARIVQGMADNAEDRAKIIYTQGGTTIQINIDIKRLGSGL